MKINKDDYIKQSWTYINTTLKYLKDLTGNIISADKKKDEYDRVAQMLKEIPVLDTLDLVEENFYKVFRYKDEVMVGKFIGFFVDCGYFKARFEVLYAIEKTIFYDTAQDIFDMSIDRLTGSDIKFEPVEITKDDLLLNVGAAAFKGKLFEKLLKE